MGMSLKFTNYLEVFEKEKEGIFLFNKLNGSIVLLETENYLKKSNELYYVGNNSTDIEFLKDHDFFSFR